MVPSGTPMVAFTAIATHAMMYLCIGVNRPDLGGTVLNSAAVSCCPDFTKLLTVYIRLPVLFAMPILTRCAAFRTDITFVHTVCTHEINSNSYKSNFA